MQASVPLMRQLLRASQERQAAAAAVKPEHLVGVGSSQLAPPQLDA